MPKPTSALDRKWDEKLYNWALWYVGGGDGLVAATSAYNRLEECDYKADGTAMTWETRDPTALIGEALDTNALVVQLQRHLFDALHAWYCLSGTEAQRAEDLGLARSTFQSRVACARVELERLDGARKRAMVKPPTCVTQP